MLLTKPTRIKFAFLFLLQLLICTAAIAQDEPNRNPPKKFPIIAGLQFQNFTLPFQDMASNFSHLGVFVGSELKLNTKRTLNFQAFIGGYKNKEMGDGLQIYSQFVYRPTLYKNVFANLKAGLGYLATFHPTPAYEYSNGSWEEVSGGKSQAYVPLEMALGYRFVSDKGEIAPFIAYQISPAFGYNKTLPFNVYTNILFGVRFHFLSKYP